MKKRIKYIVFGIIAIVLCFFYSNVDKTHSIYDTNLDNSQYQSAVIEDNSKISQSFYCQEEKLDGVAVKILVSNIEDSGSIIYTLSDEQGTKISTGEILVSEIKNQKINKLRFNEEVEIQRDSLYTVSLEKNVEEDTAVSIYFASGKRSESEILDIDGQEINGTMIIKTITHRFDLETFIVTLGFLAYFIIFMRILYKLFS